MLAREVGAAQELARETNVVTPHRPHDCGNRRIHFEFRVFVAIQQRVSCTLAGLSQDGLVLLSSEHWRQASQIGLGHQLVVSHSKMHTLGDIYRDRLKIPW